MLIADKTLFAFVDPKDPFAPNEIAGGDQSGPILSILASRQFDQVFLFHTPHTRANALATHDVLTRRFPRCIAALHELPVSDPKDYSALMGSLAHVIAKVRHQLSRHSENYVCVSSGTAEMRAAWFVLTASGFLPGRMLQIGSPIEPLFGAANVKEVSFDDHDWRNLADLVMPQQFFDWSADEYSPATSLATPLADHVRSSAPESKNLEIDSILRELNMFIGSAVMRAAVERAAIAGADNSIPILITGETGTGKEMLAKFIHRSSDRAGEPMIAVNCAAIPKDLAESHLFGHRKGAFTGASNNHAGKFEAADGGTLFLDEIGELDLGIQAKILRAIQEGQIEVVGGAVKDVDVRIIAATHRNLQAEIAAGRFREDLFYRLSVVEIKLPPLRQRPAEIPELSAALLRQINQRYQNQRQLTPEAVKRLVSHHWPGNARELNNVLQRAALFARSGVIDAADLELPIGMMAQKNSLELPEPEPGFKLKEFLADTRRRIVNRAVDRCGGNQTEAAALLGITKQAVSKILSGEADNEN
jgi:DNA-binding NtrC family response regulator